MLTNKTELLHKQNTIVYAGREIFAQKLFGKDRIAGSNESNLFISWMSIGSGGASSSDPNLPLTVLKTDVSLNNELVISTTDPATADNGKKKKFDSLNYIQDINNDNKNLIVKASMTIGRNQNNGDPINEAGLWFADSDNPSTVTTFVLASRLTFPTTTKNDIIELIFEWYYYL